LYRINPVETQVNVVSFNHKVKEGNIMGVPGWVWVVSAITIFIISWIAIYVINKAYSKKWEEPEENS
jgi:hypothetical protein